MVRLTCSETPAAGKLSTQLLRDGELQQRSIQNPPAAADLVLGHKGGAFWLLNLKPVLASGCRSCSSSASRQPRLPLAHPRSQPRRSPSFRWPISPVGEAIGTGMGLGLA